MPPGSDFQLAADILDRFVPKGKVLFKLVKQKEGQERIYTSAADPIFSGAIAVLVSPEMQALPKRSPARFGARYTP